MLVDNAHVAALEIVRRDRHEYAVDRLERAELAQQFEQAGPARAIDLAVGILRRVTARRIDQHRFLGEHEIEVARTAAALQHLIGEGKAQPRIHQGRGLPAARRPDDHVPWQGIEIAALAAARLAQLLERLTHTAGDGTSLFSTGIGPGQFSGERRFGLLDLAATQEPPQSPQRQQEDAEQRPHPPRLHPFHEQRQARAQYQREHDHREDRNRPPAGEELFHGPVPAPTGPSRLRIRPGGSPPCPRRWNWTRWEPCRRGPPLSPWKDRPACS